MRRKRATLSCCLGRDHRNNLTQDLSPMNKFTLQALALTGILAVSGLPALAADMAPASPAPNASVSTDTKANLGTSVDKTKNSAEKNVDKNKSAAQKKIDRKSVV